MSNTYFLNELLIHDVSLKEATDIILTPIEEPHGKTIHTINVDHLYKLVDPVNEKFINAYKNCDLVTLDSRVVRLIVKLKYRQNLKLCTGSDLTESLFINLKHHNNKKICIIGGDDNSAQTLAKKYTLNCEFKQYIPPMGFVNNPAEFTKCANFLEENKFDIVFVAVGCPQQELLAEYLRDNVNSSSYYLCVGASIDFLTGKQKRAPKLLQKLHLEWAHRIFQNPSRMLKRYLSNLKILNQITFKRVP